MARQEWVVSWNVPCATTFRDGRMPDFASAHCLGVSDRRAASLRIGGDKIPFRFCSEVAVWPIEIAELADYAQRVHSVPVRISHESNLLAIPKNDPDHRHVADVGSRTR